MRARWLLMMAVVLGLVALAPAQERRARVLLEDGRELIGRVVVMNLEQLQLVVDKEIVTIPAADIKSCRFEKPVGVAGSGETPTPAAPLGEAAVPVRPATGEGQVPGASSGSGVPAAVGSGSGDAGPGGSDSDSLDSGESAPGEDGARAAAGGDSAPGSKGGSGDRVATRQSGVVLHYEPVASEPPKTRFRARLAAIDARYPWLYPADPAQWISLGLLLFSALSLIIHMSVVVAGAENPHFARSLGLACCGMVMAFLQFAMVPGNDFGVFAMLIGNTALALFTTRLAFGLARSSTFVAFAVQLGLAVVVFGVLELVTTLLGSVAVA
ncbi:MAG: hypothetical protein NXI31_00425 [bacterium]|nr:hypothetical protein [bacterium]